MCHAVGVRWTALAAALVLALAGCGNDEQAAKDAIYLQMARDVRPGTTDAALLEIRTQTCAAFKADPRAATYGAILAVAVKNGATVKVAVQYTALSVASACPEYTRFIA